MAGHENPNRRTLFVAFSRGDLEQMKKWFESLETTDVTDRELNGYITAKLKKVYEKYGKGAN